MYWRSGNASTSVKAAPFGSNYRAITLINQPYGELSTLQTCLNPLSQAMNATILIIIDSDPKQSSLYDFPAGSEISVSVGTGGAPSSLFLSRPGRAGTEIEFDSSVKATVQNG